ncbi:hypothetical protein EDC04DRAFT_2658600 [Pisolithus marmoratus]|nr:hypothetical protein EDC04DRAFT_2658600 [Pisolithus marmoratus]
MSFSGTPLGQGRRLDHRTFLNKPNLVTTHHTLNPRPSALHPTNGSIPASYAYGAPTAGTRSPPKPASTSSRSAPTLDSTGNQDDTALVRYARLKRELSHNSSLNPEKWAVKDTSVNIAAAFNQAATTSYEMNPNNSWASGSQTNLNVPRSTSVEYEKETHSTSNRRLAAPPTRLTQRTNRKLLSKQASGLTHVSDSEGEDQSQPQSLSIEHSMRAKSPLETVLDISKRALGSATSFYLRQRSAEPADNSAATTNGRESSYDYAPEEREYQELQRQLAENPQQHAQEQAQQPATKKNAHRRNKMSLDNKAYRPTESDMEESDDEVSDDGRKRKKRAKKKDLGPGPLTSLPVAGYDKRRRRRRGTKLTATGEVVDDDGSSSGSEERSSAQQTIARQNSVIRTSVPPPSRISVPRGSAPPEPQSHFATDTSMDVESGLETSGLETIRETDEPPLVDGIVDTSDRSLRSFSLGGYLGWVVNRVVKFFFGTLAFILRSITLTFLMLGRALGSVVDVLVQKPIALLSNAGPRPFIILGKFAIVALAIYISWFKLYDPLIEMLPSRAMHRRYNAPDTPITNFDELTARLQNIESALSGLSLDHQRARAQQDLEARAHGEVVNRIYALEARLREETRRAADVESHHQTSASQGLLELKKQLDVLQGQIRVIESTPREIVTHIPSNRDVEALEKLKLFEERLGSVEGDIKEAVELSKQSKASPRSSDGPAWWSKITPGATTDSGLTIKASDGSDVTSLISQLVNSAVTRVSTQDIVSRADFALHSAGARPIPHLTSYTLEMRPKTFRGQVWGWMTGHGREVGRSPITALHQDTHSGMCWPMSGDFGQLGVALASPVRISDFTIDHVAKEVAFDLRGAPRDMEVWGLVEGKENLEKVGSWLAERAAQRAERQQRAEESGVPFEEDELPEDAYPVTLPKNEPFVRLATFTYDVHSPSSIQTFPIRPEVRDLQVDFGVVILVIKNNWGKKEYTCLYRFRVHGERPGGMPQPVAPQAQEDSQ